MRIAPFLLALVLSLSRSAVADAQSYIKLNGLTSLVGVPGVAYERTLSARVTFQVDATLSPWRSVNRAPMQFLILVPEWRYHPHGIARGVYVGGHVGASVFRLQKWDHRGSDQYQEGFGALFGLTVGYQRPITERVGLDVFVGGGNSQALYKGYSYLTGIRYDSAGAWNQSAEWIPYRGGVMVTYRLRGVRLSESRLNASPRSAAHPPPWAGAGNPARGR